MVKVSKNTSLLRFFVTIATIFTLIITQPGIALGTVKFPTGREDEFAENDIIFYNPTGTNCPSTGNITVVGSNASEKIWSALTSVGFTEEQAAGIMGNMMHEGNYFNPVQHEVNLMNQYWNNGAFDLGANPDVSYGLGLIQWSWTRRIGMYNYIKQQDSSLIEYFNKPETYSDGFKINGDKFLEMVGDSIYDSFIAHEIQYLWDEMNTNNTYKPILSKTTVYDAAKFFLEVVEAPQNPYIASHPERATDAQSWYDLYGNGKFSATGGSSSSGSKTTTDGSDVTIIGDSITERSASELQALMPKADIHAQSSKHFKTDVSGNDSGLKILKDLKSSGNLRKTVVFALGSNDANAVTKDMAQEVIDEAGANLLVFVTNYSPTKIDFTSNNAALKSVVGTGVVIADWEAAASQDSAKYIDGTDGYDVHPTVDDGTKLFATTIYNTITGNSSRSNTCSNDPSKNEVVNYNNHDYMFPLAGATQANYLNPGYPGPAGDSVLSRMPCGANNLCHHDYNAVDMGLRKKMIDGTEYTSSDFSGSAAGFSDMYYYSTGVKVLAFVKGTFKSYKTYSNQVPSDYVSQCASITIEGDDGYNYWLGHMSYDPSHKAGDSFELGDVIGEVGPPPCAQSTQAHLHINDSPDKTHYIIDLMDYLYEHLPEE